MENKENQDLKLESSLRELAEKLDDARTRELNRIFTRMDEQETKRGSDTH